MRSINPNKFSQFCVTALALLLLGSSTALAQQKPKQQAENSRNFWPPEFRPAAATPSAKPRTGSYKPTVRSKRRTILKETVAEPAALGVTLWLLRSADEIKQAPPKTAVNAANRQAAKPTAPNDKQDETARVLIKKKVGQTEKTEELVAERIEASTPLKVGQRLRLSVEVPQDGYLYVIDREKYADGTVGIPILIFPSNPQSDEHVVKAGRVVELPDSREYVFEVKQMSDLTNKQLVGELLSFIVAQHPLEGIPRPDPNDELIKLTNAQVEEWEAQWAKNVQIEKRELEQGAGKTRTRSEQTALTTTDQRLNQADPLPQTVFQVSVKRGSSFMVEMPLKIGK